MPRRSERRRGRGCKDGSKYGSKYRAIAKVSDVLPHVVSNVLVASQDFIDKEPDKLRAIMLAHKQSVDFVYAHPKEAAQQSLPRMVNIDLSPRSVPVSRIRVEFQSPTDLKAAGDLEKADFSALL